MTKYDDHGRPEPPEAADEVATLLGFLDYQRATFKWKTDGLDAVGMNLSVGASSMTLGGMMKHLALVEESWCSRWLAGNELGEPWSGVDWDDDPDWEWHSAALDSPDELRRLWQRAITGARESVNSAIAQHGLAGPTKRSSPEGWAPSTRWVLCHLIEEYARHNGHADLIRESVDGEVGE